MLLERSKINSAFPFQTLKKGKGKNIQRPYIMTMKNMNSPLF